MAWKRLFASNAGVDFGFVSPGPTLASPGEPHLGEETYADTTNELSLMTSPPFTVRRVSPGFEQPILQNVIGRPYTSKQPQSQL